jgi:protein-S-isoprenylcysteine O-methyltransferase Ste14
MIHLTTFNFLNVLFYLFNALWLLEFLVFKNKKSKSDYQESLSYFLLSFMIILVITATLYLGRNGFGMIHLISYYSIAQIIGVIFYIIGLFLRYYGSYILGNNFTRHVHVSSSMNLVEKGPYRYLRHPLYLGLFLITIAFPLYTGNLFVFFIFSPFLLLAILYRMNLEVKALIKLHPEYKTWLDKRYRLIPFLY